MMNASIGLRVGVFLCLVGAAVACQLPSSDDATTPATTPDGGAGEGGSDGGGGDGATADLPKPVLCPEPNPFAPKNPSSVVISDTVLKEDATWTADKVYLVGDDFKIENKKLTVEAGTTICLYQKGRILVGQGIDPGEIHLNGTAEKPIVITAPPSASDPTKPDVFHRGIQFDTYMASTIAHVNIWYGGAGGGGAAWAFELTSTAHGSDKSAPLFVDHVTVGAVQSKGVRVGTPNGLADGSRIRFTGFVTPESNGPALDAVAEINLMASRSFAKAFDASGAPIPAAARHVSLKPPASDGQIDADVDLVDVGGLPYLYKNQLVMQIAGRQDDPVGATMTIHEGVTLAMDGALIVGATSGTAAGNLVIAGTAQRPVVLTSAKDTPASGDWEGIVFVGGQYDPKRTSIDHARILYAGVDASDPLQVNHHVGRCGAFVVGALMIDGASLAPYDGPSLTNLEVAHSRSGGIVSAANDSGGYLRTSYDRPDVTFADVAGKALQNGSCK